MRTIHNFIGGESVSDYAAYYAVDEFTDGRMIRRANVGDRDPSAIAVGK